MNPIKTTQRLQTALINYLTTTFDVNKDGKNKELANKIREIFNRPEALFTGPFLEMILPYRTGKTIRDFCNNGILTSSLLELPCFNQPKPVPIPLDAPLYSHQCKAIEKLCIEEKSIIISSGTGSGKTECFSLPIVNDLLLDDTPGVRALLIYPMNALVNDQLARLRVLLNGTDITFGRFTGELPSTAERTNDILLNEIISREEIRKQQRVPQILVTNYAMLEYLLLRPEDSVIFNEGLWKYVVLDEAHTYSGAKGIEVAMLIRRLKLRLNKKIGDMLCIGTSATLGQDNAEKAANFANNLFGEDLSPDEVIFGEENIEGLNFGDPEQAVDLNPKIYLNEKFPELLGELRKDKPNVATIGLHMNAFGMLPDSKLKVIESYEHDIHAFLFNALQENLDIFRLKEMMLAANGPVEFLDVADHLFPTLSSEDQRIALYHLVELGALARESKDSHPLIPAKYHLFARMPQGIWACVNPNCPGNENKKLQWSRIFSSPHRNCDLCGAKVFPIYLCRECGQIYLAANYDPNSSTYEPTPDQVTDVTELRFLTWTDIEENYSLQGDMDEIEIEEETQTDKKREFKLIEIKLCLNCGQLQQQCTCSKADRQLVGLYEVNNIVERKRKGKYQLQNRPVKELKNCPRCGYKAKADTQVATPVTIFGVGPLVNLIHELYRLLPPSNDLAMKNKPGGGRKILTFYDNRQGAARFAAYFQDVAVNQNYKHILPIAISELQKGDAWGGGSNPTIIPLSQKCASIAWKNKIFHNDVDWLIDQGTQGSFTPDRRRAASIYIAKHILAEFTTRRRRRQSLEQIGLVGIKYAFEDQLAELEALSLNIGLDLEKTSTLIAYLLDDLRSTKAIELPEQIYPDDPVFGAHKGNPRLIRLGSPRPGQTRFIGATERQRRRKYVELVLRENGLESSEEAVLDVMTKLWDWMVETGEVFSGSASEGFRINLDELHFSTNLDWFRCSKCQRLSYRGTQLPCPNPNCGGTYYPVDIEEVQSDNYYYNLFQEKLIPVRIEEHTAQLDPEKGQKYQKLFNSGIINILSCSTTFELGIDLEDLQTVGMSNVPPTVANYRQRAGRAGRRVGGTGFIVTWASDRPHDQTYYDNPIEIIAGKVAVPKIVMENPFIMQRHINAILLSKFLRFRHAQDLEANKLRYCREFFEHLNLEEPHISFLDDWIESHHDEMMTALKDFIDLLGFGASSKQKASLKKFSNGLHEIDRDHYQRVTKHYQTQIEEISKMMSEATKRGENINHLVERLKFYQGLLERMRGNRLIDYLSGKGILPSYSFPLNTVEMILPRNLQERLQLRLERDIRQAIREYAPGSEIVADKRLWKSKKPIFWKDVARVSQYRICSNCQNLEISEDAGIPLPDNDGTCPVCKVPYDKNAKVRQYVEPDGFIADPKSGKYAKQYVKYIENQMRSALLPEQHLEPSLQTKFYTLSYNRTGKLLYVNEGSYGRGFRFSLGSFKFFDDSDSDSAYSLGHIQTTDTLNISFHDHRELPVPPARDLSFWISLMYAILQGASISLQIERRDIDGVLSPRIKTPSSWEQNIVLYDNVPGGAGHVKNIHDNFDMVLCEANRILNCNDCAPETSCTHCLRDFNNQYYYSILKRESALRFLDGYLSHRYPSEDQIPGAFKVVAPNLQYWILRKLVYTKSSASLFLESIDDFSSSTDDDLWLDAINNLILKGKTLKLYLCKLPGYSLKGLSLAKYLQVLVEKGLELWKIETLPKWHIFIDALTEEPRAIAINPNSQSVKINEVFTSTHKDGVEIALEQSTDVATRPIPSSRLDPPPNVTVRNIRSAVDQGIDEDSLFADLFKKPCKKLLVHDPYLIDPERILNRLGAYIHLANKSNTLEEVLVISKKAEAGRVQKTAEQELNNRFGGIIRFKHTADHDRYIEITRVNGEKARIIIGRGLDFIRPDGSVQDTFVVIQDPL